MKKYCKNCCKCVMGKSKESRKLDQFFVYKQRELCHSCFVSPIQCTHFFMAIIKSTYIRKIEDINANMTSKFIPLLLSSTCRKLRAKIPMMDTSSSLGSTTTLMLFFTIIRLRICIASVFHYDIAFTYLTMLVCRAVFEEFVLVTFWLLLLAIRRHF